MRSFEENKLIEEGIELLVLANRNSRKNPKPVILHSIKVGFNLDHLGYDISIVIAAILHDIIEDTNIKIKEIEARFNTKVAKLVKANSFDKSIYSKTESYKENIKRCKKAGKDALIIKAADFFDNLDYYQALPGNQAINSLFEKLNFFIQHSKNLLQDEIIYKKMLKKFEARKTQWQRK